MVERLYLAALQYLLPLYMLVSPFSTRSATLFLILIALTAIPLIGRRDLTDWNLPLTGIHLLWIPFAVWFALSPIWAEDTGTAARRVASIAGLAGLAMICLVPFRHRLPDLRLPNIALVGLVLAAVSFLVVLQRPELAGEIGMGDFNRSAISFGFVYWIILQRRWTLSEQKDRRALIPALLACLFAALFSDTQSAVLGLVVGHAALLLALAAPHVAFWLLSSSTILLFLFIRPVVELLSHRVLQPIFQLQFMVQGSASIRLSIWQEYLAMAGDRFWLGFGLDTAPAIDIKQRLVAERGGSLEIFVNFVHPHNAIVQIWFDLGAIGATLAALALFVLFAKIRQALIASPPLMGMAACAITISIVSHSLYQSWWLALITLGAIYAHAFRLQSN